MATMKQSAAGVWRIRFRHSGRQFFRSCETTEEKAANQVLIRVAETLGLLKTGRLTLPPEADGEGVGDFIVSGGKVTAKTTIKETHTLKQAVADYFALIPAGAKSPNSIATEKTHLDHFIEILGPRTAIDSIGVAELQTYVTKRSNEKGIRGRRVQPETLRKELLTFGTFRRWAKALGWCHGEIDRKTIKLPKGAEKPPFQTWAEIETIIKKGGLTDVEQSDLWDCLFLTEEEVTDFLAFVQEHGKAPWLHPALAIAARTGARRSEIIRSEIRDFDLTRGIATLREKKRVHTKSMSFRTVLPLTALIWPALHN
jgi:integrase